jgi:2-polyprenyl-6-hydroxyphenyl methylase/3-demethylubiquinone-9 3-methyltransferase
MQNEHITFSFGENWKDYLKTVSSHEINEAVRDIKEWLGENTVGGRSVIDIGSGSGIHSLAFHLLGAARVHSMDLDPNSIEATSTLWEKFEKPANWSIEHASVLDEDLMGRLGKFDIVYAWGVLHHTGQMWKALNNAVLLLKPGGYMWISLYTKGPRYPIDLDRKRRYNDASNFGKRMMINRVIIYKMLRRAKRFKNPFGWNGKGSRGMNVYHDIVDWLGGLPYEVASIEEVTSFAHQHGLAVERVLPIGEGGCSIYLLKLI